MRVLFFLAFLSCLLIEPGFGYQAQPSAFHIAIVDGEGALNNVKGRLAREPIIQVTDESHRPVEGAYVSFDTPSAGPGATFPNGATHLETTTDAQGRAVARGLTNNGVPGEFPIQVHIMYKGQEVGRTVIRQINVCDSVAKISPTMDNNLPPKSGNNPMSGDVQGIAVGSEMLVNGSSIPGNANLMAGNHVQTLASPVRLFLEGGCEFLLAPNSLVTIGASRLNLAKGIVRGEPFGNCSVAAHGLKAVGLQSTAQGIVRLNAGKLEVASVDGSVRVTDDRDRDKGTVPACTAAAFLIGGAGPGNAVVYGSLAGALAGLGIAVDAISQGPSTSP